MDEKEIEKLMEKYKDIEVPEGLFDLDEVFRKGDIIKKRRKIIKYTIKVAAVFILGIIITLILLLKPENPNEVMQQSEVPNESEIINYEKEISAQNIIRGFVEYKKSYVYSIKLKEILESTSIKKDEDTYPITKVKAEVINNFSENKMKEITFWIPGGIWNIAELKASDFIYNSDELNGLNDDDNIYLRYYEQIKLAKPEIGKTYLITLKEENKEFYIETNSNYGFKEYNPDTNCILNSNDEWEIVNMDEYLK